ncbi:hypothetical protein GQ43DRAFT_264984 [Delitschia confertaspora ATCC 74209]|uniref:Enhancer of polycomb-like protein n=1 Tax=Delitschia confertaspora ATCC 74209 TaxID=1513339 RepID=A0A9P4JQB7_9PLEO|nr:hypothetical protein GQ43DRAFT_264984 [Delitschia confertaspora ATCC 74209]
MTGDDVAFLKAYNQKRGKQPQCSEDEFEEVMNFFEETSHTKQPFAAVDNTPVLAYEDMESEFDETISLSARRFAKDIYSHWKNQRLLNGNRPLMPTLKFEMNLETDEADPYVCFRRREVRQVRKTRGRDAQVTEKLKKLRKELEEARLLMTQVKRREVCFRDQLALDKQIFDQRTAFKEIKRKLSIKTDDEDLLINQKPAPKPKPKVDGHQAGPRGIPGMGPKAQLTRPDGRIWDSDLVYLEEQQAKRTEAIDAFIEENLIKHQKWNVGWVDQTWRPITPPLDQAASRQNFRPVFTNSQLITPPSSDSSEQLGDTMDIDQPAEKREPHRNAIIRHGTPPDDVLYEDQPRFRRRMGRGGRVMIDRRGLKRKADHIGPIDERVAHRFKYDGDSSGDEEVYPVDWTDNVHIRYRIMIEKQAEKTQQAQARRAIAEVAQNRSASGHLIPPRVTT